MEQEMATAKEARRKERMRKKKMVRGMTRTRLMMLVRRVAVTGLRSLRL